MLCFLFYYLLEKHFKDWRMKWANVWDWLLSSMRRVSSGWDIYETRLSKSWWLLKLRDGYTGVGYIVFFLEFFLIKHFKKVKNLSAFVHNFFLTKRPFQPFSHLKFDTPFLSPYALSQMALLPASFILSCTHSSPSIISICFPKVLIILH